TAIGGMVVRNDVRAAVESYVDHATVSTTSLTITATEEATIKATADSVVSSSGGSAYGSGTSLAINGIIATNLILSKSNAYITDSDITTTTGDLTLDAQNTSIINAINKSVTTTGDTGVGVTLAFNTIGWEAQNILFQAIDAIIGTDIGNEQPAEVKAYIEDTDLDIAGNLSLNAESKAQLKAETSNSATSAASAIVNASGMAVSAIISSNMVSSVADAYITTGNYKYTDDQTIQELANGDRVKQDDGTIFRYIGDSQLMVTDYDYSTLTQPEELLQGKRVRLNDDIGDAKTGEIYEYIGESRTTSETAIDLTLEDYTDTDLWKKVSGSLEISLADMTFTDTTQWEQVRTTENDLTISGQITISAKDDASIDAKTNMKSISSTTNDGGASMLGGLVDAIMTDYKYSSKSGTQTVEKDHYIRVASDHEAGGVTGGIYRYKGTESASIDLDAEDFSVRDTWERITRSSASDTIPNIGNVTSSDSQAFGGIVVRNDLRSSVQSYIQYATINSAGDINISAEESATINANDESTVTSSGGSAYGTGKSDAVNGIIATNLVLSKANAFITDSDVTTTAGNLTIDAKNTSAINATINSSTSSGDKAIGVTLAFNTIGWEAQNVLFRAIDALLGTSIGNEQ
ncbi:hypothetical protein MHK_005634, partial [Candidatus Magnetomorum sp. HK-1]